MKSLKGTKTAENLLKAFAGESQARNRYFMYASTASKEGYKQIEAIFLETADHERIHANRFFKLLVEGFEGELPTGIEITADYPVALDNTLENLKAAAAGENEEWSILYPAFAETAKEEGFPEVAVAFTMVAKAEVNHENRFNKLVENIENDKVFTREDKTQWVCRKCGYIHEGVSAPGTCPTCLHKKPHFQLFVENY